MNAKIGFGFGVFVLLASPLPLLAQGATQSPPSPNASSSAPQAPDSVPPGARTLPPGTTGIQQMGTVGTTRVQPAPSMTSAPHPSTSFAPR